MIGSRQVNNIKLLRVSVSGKDTTPGTRIAKLHNTVLITTEAITLVGYFGQR